MKTVYIILIFLLLSNTLLQSQGGGSAPQQVIFLGIFGMGPNDTRNFTTTAQGTVWGNYRDPFSISEVQAAYQSTYQQTGNSDPVWSTWGGWDIVTHQTIPELIGWGFYKITTDDSPAYFYYNTRDCHYSFACGSPPPNYNPDAPFKYQAGENKFYYRIRGEVEFDPITNGQLINAWVMLNNGILPSTNGFEDFWSNALVVTNNGSGNPRAVWGPHPSFSTTHFYIYRAVRVLPVNPKEPLTYYLYAIRSASTYEFIDTQFEIGGLPTHKAYYYVKAYNSSSETFSSPTNVVTTSGEYLPYKIGSDLQSEAQPLEFDLKQNFPNPFNPTTQLDYTINLAGLVTIKVYDVLGNEVASLVNERKQPGNYSTTFDAASLPSGIYFYKLQTENFTDVKKMILLR